MTDIYADIPIINIGSMRSSYDVLCEKFGEPVVENFYFSDIAWHIYTSHGLVLITGIDGGYYQAYGYSPFALSHILDILYPSRTLFDKFR